MKIGCVLLAAGSGKRFGGDKLRYVVDGVPMIGRAATLHGSLPYALRVLVVRPGDELVAGWGERNGFTIVVNENPERGIGSSTAIGAEAVLKSGVALDGVVYAVCDQPYMNEAVLHMLFRAFAENPGCICMPAFRGRRGNPVLFPAALLPELAELREDVGGKVVIRQHEELLRLFEVEEEKVLTDIDYKGGENQ